jgi:hypothetical protein
MDAVYVTSPYHNYVNKFSIPGSQAPEDQGEEVYEPKNQEANEDC